MSFYNTIDLFGEELKTAESSVEAQNKMVYEVYQRLNMPLSPSLVYKYLINAEKITERVPITSIRRSISDLTKAGKLIKLEKKVMGNYGQYEHQWRLS